MLYIAYLPKPMREAETDRKILRFLKWYVSTSTNEYSIISAPGYLSRGEYRINQFLRKLSRILVKRKGSTYLGILNGMNGHHYANGSNKTILEVHNDRLTAHNFQRIIMKPSTAFDHRKMMCFFKYNNHPEFISSDTIDEFLDDIYVGGILIGSSNQSYLTYFQEYASKGEADVFIFDAENDSGINSYIKNVISSDPYPDIRNEVAYREDVFSDIVLTRSIHGLGHTNSQEFLKNILKDILKTGLE